MNKWVCPKERFPNRRQAFDEARNSVTEEAAHVCSHNLEQESTLRPHTFQRRRMPFVDDGPKLIRTTHMVMQVESQCIGHHHNWSGKSSSACSLSLKGNGY